MPQVIDPNKEELYTICDDVAGPGTQRGQTVRGQASTLDFTNGAFAKPRIVYTGRFGKYVLDGDLYFSESDGFSLHILCPVCSVPEKPHGLWVKSKDKRIEWDAERGISIEAFGCTWELPEDRTMHFGLGLCSWRVAIENNVARDA